jgi:hypothetical protein
MNTSLNSATTPSATPVPPAVTTAPQSAPQAQNVPVQVKKKMPLQVVLGALALVLLVIGGSVAYYLSVQTTELRQQASGGDNYSCDPTAMAQLTGHCPTGKQATCVGGTPSCTDIPASCNATDLAQLTGHCPSGQEAICSNGTPTCAAVSTPKSCDPTAMAQLTGHCPTGQSAFCDNGSPACRKLLPTDCSAGTLYTSNGTTATCAPTGEISPSTCPSGTLYTSNGTTATCAPTGQISPSTCPSGTLYTSNGTTATCAPISIGNNSNGNNQNFSNCSGTKCTISQSQACANVSCVGYYCPGGLVNGRCLQGNPTPVSGGAPGATIDFKPYMNNTCGAYQFDCDVPSMPVGYGGCGAVTYNLGNNCSAPASTPVPSFPPPTTPPSTPPSSPTPPPVGPVCLNITSSKATPQIGDSLNFTCGTVNGANHYEFRIQLPDGTVKQLTATGTSSENFTVSQSGKHTAQCRICTTADAASCQAYESF